MLALTHFGSERTAEYHKSHAPPIMKKFALLTALSATLAAAAFAQEVRIIL